MPIEVQGTSLQVGTVEAPICPKRDVWQASRRGFGGRCPCCGKGAMFRRYLKVNDRCASCGTELLHHRADDAPPYFTILVVGHILGALMLSVEEFAPNLPLLTQILIWPTLASILCLALLPAFKGALIGYQWALRMHGFETAAEVPSEV
ncbi:MAG: DUF983 domain-containing protein [Methylovirgula sp.]